MKEKIKLSFLRLFDNPLLKSYFKKIFLHAIDVFGYLAKLQRDLRLDFGAHFQHDFSKKCSVFNTLSMDKVSMSHLNSFSRYQTCAIKFVFRHLMIS